MGLCRAESAGRVTKEDPSISLFAAMHSLNFRWLACKTQEAKAHDAHLLMTCFQSAYNHMLQEQQPIILSRQDVYRVVYACAWRSAGSVGQMKCWAVR